MTTPFSRLATPTGSQTPSSYTYGDSVSDTDWIAHTAHTNLSPATYQENAIDNVSSLKDLLSSLIESQVPGPQLYRLKTEFGILEEGGQSEIFGVGMNTQEILAEATRCGQLEQDAWPVDKIVIKRHRPRKTSSYGLGSQFLAARREILALAPSRFRDSPNIVQLKGWGLCLDTLEDKAPGPRTFQMPLLILERASCDLEVFVQGPSRASNSLLLGLCRDIGNGLAALHAEGFTHGDLKPKNVLIFETLTGWIAKLCDFGCALQKVEDVDAPDDSFPKEPHPRPRYLGTDGWKPPEAASPGTLDLNHEDWKLCDVYVFGLVVWSVFCKSGKPPLEGSRIEPDIALRRARQDIETRKSILGSYSGTILRVLEETLRRPRERSFRPWIHLRQPIRSLGFAMRLARGIFDPRMMENIRIRAGSKQSQPYFRRVNASRVHRPLRPIEKREIDKHLVSKANTELVISESTNSGDEGPSIITLRRRTTSSVEETTEIWTAISRCFSGPAKPTRLYYWARRRSDVSLALWNDVGHDVSSNFLEVALKSDPAVDTVTLAWLCRGEVGAWEVENLQPNFETWGAILGTSFLSESERLERFLLLLQSGAQVEKLMPTSPSWDDPVQRTILFEYVRNCRKVTVDLVMKEVCSQFRRVLNSPRIKESTKAHLMPAASRNREELGRGLVENSALQDFVTEVNLAVVKHLLDPKLAAYVDLSGPQMIAESNGVYEDEFVRDAMEIIELFDRALNRRQSSGGPQQTTREPDQRVAAGWDTHRIEDRSKASGKLATYLLSPQVQPFRRTGLTDNRYIYHHPKSHSYTTRVPTAGLGTETIVRIGYLDPSQGAHSVNVAYFLPTIAQTADLDPGRFPSYTDEWYSLESQYMWPPPYDPLGAIPNSWNIPSFADRVDPQLLPMLVWRILRTTPMVLIIAGLRLLPLLLLLRQK
ncbi:hypothetical protein PG984_014254 [Apiospora sp. TS-2023a]